jgi:hypothetical protein
MGADIADIADIAGIAGIARGSEAIGSRLAPRDRKTGGPAKGPRPQAGPADHAGAFQMMTLRVGSSPGALAMLP